MLNTIYFISDGLSSRKGTIRILCGLLCWICATQTLLAQDKALFNVHYLTQYKLFAEDKRLRDTEMVLEVGHRKACFYNRWARIREHIVDSLSRVNADENEMYRLVNNYPSPGLHYCIYENCTSSGKRIVTDQMIQDFYYEEEIEYPQWTIERQDSVLLGYKCTAATCEYRGRRWTAFYTSELPVSEGPWKLKGLPGLVLYAVDSSGVFSFKAISIVKSQGVIDAPDLSRHIKCTRKDLNNMYIERARNPKEFGKRFGLTGASYTADGKPLVYPERRAMILDE